MSLLVSLQVSLQVYDRFTTGFRQVSETMNTYVQTNAVACFPRGFPTGLPQVYNRLPADVRDSTKGSPHKCHYTHPYRFPYMFTTGLSCVSDMFPDIVPDKFCFPKHAMKKHFML